MGSVHGSSSDGMGDYMKRIAESLETENVLPRNSFQDVSAGLQGKIGKDAKIFFEAFLLEQRMLFETLCLCVE